VAVGLERIILALKELGVERPAPATPEVFLAYLGEEPRRESLRLMDRLRRAGVGAYLALGRDRGLRSQLREADKRNVRYTVIIGGNELESGQATVRNMKSGDQVDVPLGSELVTWFEGRM
jgi:histidyl-tRNA synthetase